MYSRIDEDVLVLAGDIHTRYRHEEIIKQVPPEVQILFVAGNHEYYRSEFNAVNEFFYNLQAKYPNFKWLNNERFVYNDVDFYGGTMYTDFSLYGERNKEMAIVDCSRGINDFYVTRIEIDGETRTWRAEDHEREFRKFERGLKSWLKDSEASEKRIVISHFAPSPQTIAPQYEGSLINPYFTVDMEKYMGWKGMWLYGHTHSSCDLMVGETRVIANPKGYGNENARAYNPHLVLEI